MQFRQAKLDEVDRILEICEEGRQAQLRAGFVQWTEDYPNREVILADIHSQIAWVVDIDGEIAAYTAIHIGTTPEYDAIEGAWHHLEPSIALHRFAVGDGYRGKGIAQFMFEQAELLFNTDVNSVIRVDTSEENKAMLALIQKMGYDYCGTVVYEQGKRLAFDKIIPAKF